jgi:potassium/chloride transporter 9
MKPFPIPYQGVEFTGLRLKTLMGNLKPHLTKGAAGSQIKGRETFQDLFGILFPATGGIFAGASMSGDLRNPSKSIPKGTLSGLALTFVAYGLVILAMAASVTRESFYNNVNVIQIVSSYLAGRLQGRSN